MAQYIDKDALVAKIKRRFDECSSSILKHYDACKEAKALELGKILTIIDTLEAKKADLTREDVSKIISIDQQVCGTMGISSYTRNHQQAMEEVLKRFKAQKGE